MSEEISRIVHEVGQSYIKGIPESRRIVCDSGIEYLVLAFFFKMDCTELYRMISLLTLNENSAYRALIVIKKVLISQDFFIINYF